MRKGQRGLVKRTSKRPPTTDGSASARAMAERSPVRQHDVGVQEQERVAPRHPRARVHLARPPARARDKRTEARRLATSAVASALPPSTTMTSASGQRAARSGRKPLEIRRLVERGNDDAQHAQTPLGRRPS